MSTLVVHGAGARFPEDVAWADALAGDAPIHVLSRDVALPDGLLPGRTFRVPSEGDPEFLDPFMCWISELFRELDPAQELPELEIARYRLLFGLARVEYRRWVLRTVHEALAPRRVLWTRPGSGPLTRTLDLDLVYRARELGARLEWARPPRARSGAAFARLKETAYPYADHLRRSMNALVGRSGGPRPSGVVFFEYYTNSCKVLLPVEQHLAEQHQLTPLWLAGRREVAQFLANERVPHHALEELVGARFVRAGVPPVAAITRVVSALPRARALGASGGSRALRVCAVAPVLAGALTDAHRWLLLSRAALARARPTVLVSTTYSSVPGRAMAVAANELGARSLFVEHGSYPDRDVWSHFLHRHKAMWGEYARRSLVRNGHEPSSVHALGATIYDDFSRRAQARPWAPPARERPWTIVFMASRTGGVVSSEAVSRATLKALVAAVGSLTNAQLVVKAHPGDSTRVPEEETAGRPGVRLVRGGSSQDLILEADVVVVVSSTTGFEACVAGRPLLELNLTGLAESAEYASAGAALLVTDASAVGGALERLRLDRALVDELRRRQRELVQNMLCGADGRAAERVGALIVKLATQEMPS